LQEVTDALLSFSLHSYLPHCKIRIH